MSAAAPDNERRLVPRWRSSTEAINCGELRSPRNRRHTPERVEPVPEFDEAIAMWKSEKSVEAAAEVVSAAVVLGRTSEVQEPARLLAATDSDTSVTMRSIAERVLSGSVGQLAYSGPLGFSPNEMQIRASIAALKQQIRRYPRDAIGWMDLARLYTVLGQRNKARSAIDVAVRLAPDNRFILRSAARFYLHGSADLERGLAILQGTRALRSDPWLMAAELSLAQIARASPKSFKRARNLSEDDELDPWDTSELNGALATIALTEGGLGKPSKLFRKSLRSPTENALAQAEWAANEHRAVLVPDNLLNQPKAFEALAIDRRAKRDWRAVLDACKKWSALEPTSSRPLLLGTFVATAALEDGAAALEFVERARLSNPDDPTILNNEAVAYAYLGKTTEARAALSRINPRDVPELSQPAYLATQGLVFYREMKREEGMRLYIEAANTKASREHIGLRALVAWHLLREEARMGARDAAEVAGRVWAVTKGLPIPELAALHAGIERQSKPGALGGQQLAVEAMTEVLPESQEASPELLGMNVGLGFSPRFRE